MHQIQEKDAAKFEQNSSFKGYFVNHGAKTPIIMKLTKTTQPIILMGLKKWRKNFRLDLILSISYSILENSGILNPGTR